VSAAARTVLFLCTGNYYRSRFAEVVFNHLARERGVRWTAQSRGLKLGWPGNVGPISPHTEQRLRGRSIALDACRRMPLKCGEGDLCQADLVVALKETEHRPLLSQSYPGWDDRVTYWHVHDVDQATPEKALAEIEQLVRELIDRLTDEQAGGSAA